METKKKRLVYRRAIWERNSSSNNLQDLIVQAHNRLKNTEDRTFSYSEGEIQGTYVDLNREEAFCCHVTYYVPKQNASVVPNPSKSNVNNVDVLPPPKDKDYMIGDIFFMSKGNDLVFCASGVRESVAIGYIEEVLKKCFNDEITLKYSIDPVADMDKVKILKKEGIKKVALNASLYEASMNHLDRNTPKNFLVNGLIGGLKAIFLKDEDDELQEIHEKENISVNLELLYDSRKKDGQLGQRRMLELSKRLVNEDKGFTIETKKGTKITSDDMRLSQIFDLPIHGSSISMEATFNSLLFYHKELIRTGLKVQ